MEPENLTDDSTTADAAAADAVTASSVYASTPNCSDALNCTIPDYPGGRPAFMTLILVLYGLICFAGTVGNGLVIVVILRFAKMRSVTNTYIFNLALSDFLFLLGLPFLIVTVCQQMWIFGYAMCKIFYILTSLNQFTSILTLTVMSADRYFAVCHAVASMPYRTPVVARVVCLAVWVGSFLIMLPIILYAKTVEDDGGVTCTIEWPKGQAIQEDHAFIWYTFCLSFAVPVSLISVFYFLVVLRLKTAGPNKNTKGKRKSQRRVTILVLSVVTVYVVCWLPYWIFQTIAIFLGDVPFWAKLLFQTITVLSYANSTLNPILYAFLSDNFRQTFVKACQCASALEVNRTLFSEQTSFNGSRRWRPGSRTWSRARSYFASRKESEKRKSGRNRPTSGSKRCQSPDKPVELEELVENNEKR